MEKKTKFRRWSFSLTRYQSTVNGKTYLRASFGNEKSRLVKPGTKNNELTMANPKKNESPKRVALLNSCLNMVLSRIYTVNCKLAIAQK